MITNKNITEIVRTALIGDSALIALVPASKIAVADNQAKALYPHISIGVDGGCGNDYETAKSGTINLTIYAKTNNAPNERVDAFLDSIYQRIKAVLHEKELSLSLTSEIRIDTIYETYESRMMAETDIAGLFFKTAKYSYVAHSRL